MPAAGRSAANVMLDAIVAFEPGQLDSSIVDLALHRLAEVGGAYEVTVDDNGEDVAVAVDLSNLLGGTLVALQWLTYRLAEERATDPEVVVSDLRAFLSEE